MKWYIIKSAPSCCNMTKAACYADMKSFTYPNQDELLNKRSELLSKCRHVNEYLLCNYKANG